MPKPSKEADPALMVNPCAELVPERLRESHGARCVLGKHESTAAFHASASGKRWTTYDCRICGRHGERDFIESGGVYLDEYECGNFSACSAREYRRDYGVNIPRSHPSQSW